jgi:hypothetical protein
MGLRLGVVAWDRLVDQAQGVVVILAGVQVGKGL